MGLSKRSVRVPLQAPGLFAWFKNGNSGGLV